MILYQCYAPAQPTTSPLLFFFTPTLIQPPSHCPLSSTLLFPVLPTPSLLVPTLSLSPYSLGCGFGVRTEPRQSRLKQEPPPPSSSTRSFRRGSRMCVSSSCRDQALVFWAEALLGAVEAFYTHLYFDWSFFLAGYWRLAYRSFLAF